MPDLLRNTAFLLEYSLTRLIEWLDTNGKTNDKL